MYYSCPHVGISSLLASQSRALYALRANPPPSGGRNYLLVCSSISGRGFGARSKVQSDDDERRRVSKGKRVNIRREEEPIPGQGNNNRPLEASPAFAAVASLEDQIQKAKEDEDFAKRLAVIRLEGEDKRKETQTTSAATEDAVFNINYADPPKLSETLMSQLNADVSDPKMKTAQIGPNQLGIAIGAVLLGLMFVLVSGADFASSKRYKGVRPAQSPPDGIEASLIKGRIAQLENARQADPTDSSALEELAVSYAQLLDYEKAARLLDKLVAAQPKNLEAWRLLGECTLLLQQPSRSVAAYERAVAISSSDIQVLTGLADAYIANGQQSKAVDFITTLKGTKTLSSDMPKATPASVDSTTMDLLLAKVYSSWRGHDNDALAVYDGLIKGSPEDFRSYLAKGLFLKEHGRKSDAERMFMQARFYAPESRQGFIKQMAGSNPVLDLPGDD